jgi:hypothetical protein
MKIIDLTYFVNERFLPNIADNPNLVSNNDQITQLVSKYEIEFLFMALGFELANEFLTALETEPIPEKWQKFLNGDGEWKGLVKNYDGYKTSIVADYVYCSWLYENENQATSVGADQAKSNWLLIVKAWQEFYKWYYEMFEYLNKNKESFEGWKFTEIENLNTMQL